MTQRQLRILYIGVFCTTLAAIIFEITLTRIFSVTLWYHFAYFVVSLALFGLGFGGLVAFFARQRLASFFPGILKYLATLQFLSMISSLVFVLLIDPDPPIYSFSYIFAISSIYVVCAIPFVFVGAIISLVMRHFVDQVPKIYFADLLGSATGCLIFVGAISLVSGPAVILLAAILALCASCLFDKLNSRRRAWIQPTITVAAALILVLLETQTGAFRIRHTKTYDERDDVIYEKWSPLARITVYPRVFFLPNLRTPFGWGMSRTYVPSRQINQLWIEQDGSAGTPITEFSGDLKETDFLGYDITSFAYHVWPETESVYIIGPGGGRDVLTAMQFGVASITGCDINPVIVDLVQNRFKDFAGDIYSHPSVTMIVGEGRSTLRRMDKKFDGIFVPLVDSWAATSAGAFALAENNLYTVEALQNYLDHLSEQGYLSMTRFLFKPRRQMLRLAIIARRALEVRGSTAPEKHLAVIGNSTHTGVATLLVRKTPFTEAEVKRLVAAAKRLEFEVLFAPGLGGDPAFVGGITQRPLEDFLKNIEYDLSPSTDDRPFFFQMIPFLQSLDLLTSKTIVGQNFNYHAPLVLIILMALAALLVLLFFIVPLAFTRGVEPLPRRWGFFSILLGLGFMFVEIPLLQKGSLYLGHPTYSLTIVLFSMLLLAGLGSQWSGRKHRAPLMVMLRRYLLVTSGLVLLLAIGSDAIITATIGQTLWVRAVIFVILTGIPAFFMGTAFPSAVRLVGGHHANSIPWVWALNGGASVLGSILAMAVAMTIGYWLTLVLAGGCYLLAFATVVGNEETLPPSG